MSKFNNVKHRIGDETYRSGREMRRHQWLLIAEKAGQIASLRREVPFVLAPKVSIEGEKRARPAVRYMADFVYVKGTGQTVVEDAKGMSTPVYRLKKHLMKTVHNIDVVEV